MYLCRAGRGLEEKILNLNPFLEAFGNAKTGDLLHSHGIVLQTELSFKEFVRSWHFSHPDLQRFLLLNFSQSLPRMHCPCNCSELSYHCKYRHLHFTPPIMFSLLLHCNCVSFSDERQFVSIWQVSRAYV